MSEFHVASDRDSYIQIDGYVYTLIHGHEFDVGVAYRDSRPQGFYSRTYPVGVGGAASTTSPASVTTDCAADTTPPAASTTRPAAVTADCAAATTPAARPLVPVLLPSSPASAAAAHACVVE